jgi:hypothetical protein
MTRGFEHEHRRMSKREFQQNFEWDWDRRLKEYSEQNIQRIQNANICHTIKNKKMAYKASWAMAHTTIGRPGPEQHKTIHLEPWTGPSTENQKKGSGMVRGIEPDVNRTRNLLIWSQTRYHCATDPEVIVEII